MGAGHAIRWASDELAAMLAELTSQQADGVRRIVEAELAGETIDSLLDCPDQICASTTYYRRGGWKDKPLFKQALRLARRDYRTWILENSTSEALLILSSTTPDAVRALRQQVVGDESALAVLETALQATEPELRANAAMRLGQSGLSAVVPALTVALQREKDPQVKTALVDALGKIAGFRDSERRIAATAVLDRATVDTASKAAPSQGERTINFTGLSDEELRAIIAGRSGAGTGGEDASA